MFTGFRLKVRGFYRENKRKILIIIIFWAIIFAVNTMLKLFKEEERPKTTYEPHTSVMNFDSEVPKKLQGPIVELIDEYIQYCNNKEYEKAYDMLVKGCKDEYFPNIEGFKLYVDTIFNSKKIYNIQNYSNQGDIYIYNVRILDDILATGINEERNELYYEEKVVIENTKDGLTFAIKEYIQNKEMEVMYEDENVKIVIQQAIISYDTEKYIIRVTNKTDNVLVLSEDSEINVIGLNLGSTYRKRKEEANNQIVVLSDRTSTFTINFSKYFDDGKISKGMLFANLRIVESYPLETEKRLEILKTPIESYSIELKF